MTFLNRRTEYFLYYLFTKQIVAVNTKTKTVCEVGQQRLRLFAINMRPMKETQCVFILEFIKDKRNDEVYQPIVIEYTVSVKDGPDANMTKLTNLIRMAFKEHITIDKGLVDVYSQLARMRGRYVNAIIKHKTFIVMDKGKVVYDDSLYVRELFGNMEPKTDHVAYIYRIRHESKPYHSTEINYFTLIDPPKDHK